MAGKGQSVRRALWKGTLGAMLLGVSGVAAPAPAGAGPAISGVHAFGVSSSTVYVAAASGLYRAAAPYTNWTRQAALGAITALSPDPQRPDHLVYVATAMYAISPTTVSAGDTVTIGPAAQGDALYYSTDGGHSATAMTTTAGLQLTSLVRAPSAPAILYAAGSLGDSIAVLKSADDGLSWTPAYTATPAAGMSQSGVQSLAVDPTNAAHVLAGAAFYHSGAVLETTDGGATWHSLPDAGMALAGVGRVAIGPHAPRELWASWFLMGYGQLDRSTDGGRIWSRADNELPPGTVVTAIRSDALGGRVYLAVQRQGHPNSVWASSDSEHYQQFAPGAPDLAGEMVIAGGYLLSGDDGHPLRVYPLIGPATWAVAAPFARYYGTIAGMRVLGRPLGPWTWCADVFRLCQVFEKGRLQAGSWDPTMIPTYGAIVSDLLRSGSLLPVGGGASTVTYRTLQALSHAPLVAPPAGFHGGVAAVSGGTFVPDSPVLARAAGHVVPSYFWAYMQGHAAMPEGWLRDLGLPLTNAMPATVTKGALGRRTIMVQAFQRGILTYDPRNAPSYRVERANTGADFARAFPTAVR